MADVNTLTLYMPGSSVGIQVWEGSQLHLILVSQGANSIPSAPGEVVRQDPFPQYVDDDELAAALAGVGGGGGAVDSVNGQTGSVTLTFSDVGAVSSTDPRLSDARTPTAHTHPTTEISDSTTVGRSVLTATDATAARTAIGAGTSSLTLGTTGTTAAAGNDTRIVGASQRALSKRTVTGAYTLVAADAVDMVLHSTAASALTITVPQDSAATIAQEIAIPWRQYGAGQITFAAGTGATLISRGSVFKSAGQYAEGLVTKVAANTWLLSGDIA